MASPRNPVARRLELKRLLLAHETASVETLCDLLSASPATIRRDLAALQAEGILERTHGGAVRHDATPAEQNFAQRELLDVEEKRLIAAETVRLIPPQSTVFLNDGSTVAAVAKAILVSGLEIFVATPSVNVALMLAESPQVTTCLLGGVLRAASMATTGYFAEAMAAQINADLAVIAPDGIDQEGGMSFARAEDASLALRMTAQSSKVVAVVTARKFRRRERVSAVPCGRISTLVTGAPPAVTAPFAKAGIGVVHARDHGVLSGPASRHG